MVVNSLSFGSITIDGKTYHKDIVIDHGAVKKRKKSESKKYSSRYGHTPLSSEENIPWHCKYLIIGSGHDMCLPVMDEIYEIAHQKHVMIRVLSTPEAIKHVNDSDTNFVIHLTC
jgi:hypothetical protein